MIEVGKTFMYRGTEYRITHLNKDRINLDLIGGYNFCEINDKIEIENIRYRIIYVHKSKNRITVEPVF